MHAHPQAMFAHQMVPEMGLIAMPTPMPMHIDPGYHLVQPPPQSTLPLGPQTHTDLPTLAPKFQRVDPDHHIRLSDPTVPMIELRNKIEVPPRARLSIEQQVARLPAWDIELRDQVEPIA